jgi:hypothetical protein
MHSSKGIQINGDWKAVIASIVFVIVFAILPISLNEVFGINNIAASLTQPQEEINPYYSSGEVAGIITNSQIQANAESKYITFPIINLQIEITKQNLLIFSVAAISTIIFIVLYSLLTLLDNKNSTKENELLPQNEVGSSI